MPLAIQKWLLSCLNLLHPRDGLFGMTCRTLLQAGVSLLLCILYRTLDVAASCVRTTAVMMPDTCSTWDSCSLSLTIPDKQEALHSVVPGDLQKESRYILAANDAQVPSHAQWWACFLIQSFGTADRNEFMQQISAAGFERPELVHKIHDDFHGRICICNPIQLGDVKNIHQLFKVSVMWFVRRTRLT